jgi:2-dehydro-3-deoxygalactonokinase
LLNLVFSARTRGLMSELPGGDLADYLSGLLIGAEILDAAADGGTVAIIAGEALAIRYRDACARFGIAAVVAPPDCAVAGLAAIGETAGWMAR